MTPRAYPGPRPPRPYRRPEKTEQANGVALLRLVSRRVYVLGVRRRATDYQGTMQTPGIPDVYAVLKPLSAVDRPRPLWWECKAVGGRLRPEQAELRDIHAEAGLAHVVGTFQTLADWLVDHGYLSRNQLPAYRTEPQPGKP